MTIMSKVRISEKGAMEMSSTAVVTLVKMVESLPDTAQEQVVEHLREYIATLQDELQWNATFKKTQSQLAAAARRAKQEIAEGRVTPLNHRQL